MKKIPTPTILASISMLLLLAIAACVPAAGNGAAEKELAGTTWRLQSYGQTDGASQALDGAEVTLKFEQDGRAGGSAGCNTYGGKYEVKGNRLVFSEVVATLMACLDENVMAQERLYLNALTSAGEYDLNGDQLMIQYEDGVLVFTRAAQP